jgi:putative ABC transport system permease protein
MSGLYSRLKALIFRKTYDRDLRDEFDAHLAMDERERIELGEDPKQAYSEARRDFGNVLAAFEETRMTWGWASLERLCQDLRLGFRRLRHNPGLTIVVVGTLAFGIGANAAIFSVVNAVLLRPLAYADATRLVGLWSTKQSAGIPRGLSSLPDYREWRARTRTLQEMGAYHENTYSFTGTDTPERLTGTRMTASVWTSLQARPLLGSLFGPQTEEFGQHRVVVLSEKLWRRRFGADPEVIGRKIELNAQQFTIVGVVPATFEFPDSRQELWSPIAFPPGSPMNTRRNYFVNVVARMKPGITVAQVQDDVRGIAEQLSREFTENTGLAVAVADLHESMVGDVRPMLWLLLGAVAMVLLITCVNIANLLLARAASRKKEFTVQAALGCSRARLIRQFLAESALLSGAGGFLAIGIAYALLRTALAFAPPVIPRLQEVSLDLTAIAFIGLLVILTGLAFGAWPAWRASGMNLSDSLKESGRVGSGRVRQGMRSILVGAEVALSFVLLIGAGLLILSLVRLQGIAPGFRPNHLLTMEIGLIGPRYGTTETLHGSIERILREISAVPSVADAGATSNLPIRGCCWGKSFSIVGRPGPASVADVPTISYSQVTSNYFRAMGATLVEGRFFDERDAAGAPGVAIVNETLARRFWPNENPVGQRISLFPPDSLLTAAGVSPNPLPENFPGYRMAIVGVVADLRKTSLDEEDRPGVARLMEEVYVPIVQGGQETARGLYFVVRTQTPPVNLAKAVESAIHNVDRNLPVARMQSMEQLLDAVFARRRFAMLLLGFFALLAVVTALVGLYGVIAYLVRASRHDLGIHIAIGAAPSHVVRLVVARGLWIAVAGISVGFLLATGLSSLIKSQLFGVSALDPFVYLCTALLLISCSALASWVPARRASRLNPVETLRGD